MSPVHDYDLANQSGASFRADLNNALQAILTNNSSASAPSTTAAYMFWADTTTGTLKIRNSSNNGWVELLQLDGTLTLEDGSASAVALGFRDELNTGIFSSGASNFDVSIAGTTRLNISATGLNVTGTVTDDGATHDGDVTFTGAAANVVFDKSDNALEFADNAKAVFGAGGDLTLLHDGTDSKITNITGNLVFEAKASETAIKIIPDGSVEVYHDNVKRFETTSTGADITGVLTTDGADHNGDVQFFGANYGAFWDKSASALKILDNTRLILGTSSDLTISHDGSNSIINDSGTGELLLQRAGNTVLTLDANGVTVTDPDGTAALRVMGFEGSNATLSLLCDEGDDFGDNWQISNRASDNTLNMRNNASGSLADIWAISTAGDVTQTGHLDLPDSKQIRLGASDDLTIEHDGSNSIINDNGTGELQLQRAGNTILTLNATGIEITDPSGDTEVTITGFEGNDAFLNLNADQGDDNGDKWSIVSVAANNTLRLKNNISGSLSTLWTITTDGDVVQTGKLTIPDDKTIEIGNGDDLKITHVSSSGKTDFDMLTNSNVRFINRTSNDYGVIIGSHESGTDDNRQMLQIQANGQRTFHSDINGNLMNYASLSIGRVRTDANNPVNDYRNAPHAVNIYSGRTDDATNYRANLKLCSADHPDGQSDSSIIYFTESGSDTDTVDHDQDQKFSVKQNGMVEGMSFFLAGRVKSDERTSTNVVFGSSEVYVQATYNTNMFSRMRTRATDNTDDVLLIDTGGGVVIKFESQGNGRFDGGADVGNASDYAEYFEWADGNTSTADRRGITVVMDGEKIKPATDSDDKSKIIGVVSANPAVVGDSAWSEWQAAHKKDAYGSWVTEDKEYLIWNDFTTTSTVDDPTQTIAKQPDPSDPNVAPDFQILVSDIEKEKAAGRCPQAAIDQNLRITRPSRVYNESYDATKTYEPRSARKEWDAIGLMGKLVVRRGQPIGTNWILMKSNVGTDPNDVSIILDKYLVR
tara:strand:+ start:539 stop:3505 length:2967 start_codon:yes stop_codon:yes gene_type:complete